MADSTHDDGAGAGGTEVDDFDLSAEDHSQDAKPDSPDDGADAKGDDTSASSDDDSKGDTPADKSKTPALDPDLSDWAVKTGRVTADEAKELTDRELKLMQDIRNGQRDFSRARSPKKQADDLNKVITEAKPKPQGDDDGITDPLEKKVNALESNLKSERATRLQSEYFSANNITQEEVGVMGEILKEKADRGNLKAFEALSDPENISDLHDLAKIRMGKSSSDDAKDVVDQAKQEERNRLAKISKAGGPTRSAKSAGPAKQEDELTAMWKDPD